MLRFIFLCMIILFAQQSQAQNNYYWDKGNLSKTADDMPGALKWYTFSATEEKNGKAAYYVALIYEKGLAGTTDLLKSFEFYRLAGDLGNNEGYYEVAEYYHKKWFAEPDFSHLEFWSQETKEYFKKATLLGDPDAERKLNLFITEEKDFLVLHEKNIRDQKDNDSHYTSPNKRPNSNNTGLVSPKHKMCTECHGTGKIHTTFTSPVKDANGYTHYGEYSSCPYCMGKGYLN